MVQLIDRIDAALAAVRALGAAFGEEAPALSRRDDEALAALASGLEALILARVEVLNAFELLIRISPERAITMLLRLYLGSGVSPDTKFGGYESELDVALDDLRELAGERALQRLVCSSQFDVEKWQDPRVLRSFAGALSTDAAGVAAWRRSVGA
ncbi:MAG: hypothetical protein R3A51_20705 [Nannocystaceae bacterium]|nr:hypothetical protein [Myxococcales bacterium]